jgi:alginate O-acetyltransferase complex protein AlgI
LLAASCLFYMAFVPIYILILLITIIIDYVAGIMIENATEGRKKLFLVVSIVANVGMLSFFKYYNFFVANVDGLFNVAHIKANLPLLNIILPLGLSFHTFQAMSYTIEVYRGNQKAERHLGIYALYVMFYPQLVAGPIERPQNMLHQFHEPHKLDYENVTGGLRLILWGIFKKLIIADRLSKLVDRVYDDYTHYSGTSLAVAAIFFAFQIYCDFSAYSDIALGSARVMGFKLMVNFDRPFSSRSITEFWRRWHISLSTWFYDYVFNPLVTHLRHWGKIAIAFALMLTFFLSGVWHGAGWQFIIYGLIHGIAIVYEFYTKKIRKRIFKNFPKWLNNGISICLTFCYVAFSWIFFRSASVAQAWAIVNKIVSVPVAFIKMLSKGHILKLDFSELHNQILPCIMVIVFLEIAQFLNSKYHLAETFGKLPGLLRWSLYFSGLAAILGFGIHSAHQFIYFQF